MISEEKQKENVKLARFGASEFLFAIDDPFPGSIEEEYYDKLEIIKVNEAEKDT